MKTAGMLRLFVLSLTIFSWPAMVMAQDGRPPHVTPASDGIIALFRDHPVVGLADNHGNAQQLDFYAALIRDPRFAQEVGNLVLESGEASSQSIIDRYVNGENVPYEELRKVWSSSVGAVPTVSSLGAVNVYAVVREVNSKLSPAQRIRVWLGEPPIDWSKMHGPSDVGPVMSQRGTYTASLIEREILAKKKKALVIYGMFHFHGSGFMALLSQAHPGAFVRVSPYIGFVEKTCSEDFERQIANWPVPALAHPVQGTSLAAQLKKAGCHFNRPNSFIFHPSMSPEAVAKERSAMEDQSSGIAGEAFLYLGPAASLTKSPMMPDIYLDFRYRDEIARRNAVRGLPPLGHGVGMNPASPVKIHPY